MPYYESSSRYDYYKPSRTSYGERLRRSRIELDAVIQDQLQTQHQLARKQSSLIKRKIQDQLEDIGSFRSKYEYQTIKDRQEIDYMAKKARIQADIQSDELHRQAALRRSRLQRQIRFQNTNRNIEKSRLQSELQASRLNSKRTLEDSLRRFKVQNNINYFLNKY